MVIEGSETPDGKKLKAEMDATVLPWVEFDNADIADIVRSLNAQIRKLNPADKKPIFIYPPRSFADNSATPLIWRNVNLTLEKAPLSDVLAYICEQTQLQYELLPDRGIQLYSAVLYKARQDTVKKIANLTIDHVDFRQADIIDVVAFLNEKCKKADPGQDGVRIVLRLRPSDLPLAKIANRKITMTLHGAPLLDILQDVTEQTAFEFTVDPNVVVVRPGRSDD